MTKKQKLLIELSDRLADQTETKRKLDRSLALQKLIPGIFDHGAVSSFVKTQFDTVTVVFTLNDGTQHYLPTETLPAWCISDTTWTAILDNAHGCAKRRLIKIKDAMV